MKAKLLFTALALPVAFAACTSDEMETLGNTDLGNRIQLQNVNITLGNAATRMVQGDGNKDGAISFNELLFEANDGMGACLIDQVDNLTDPDPVKRYNLLTDKVNSNYRYSYNGSAWSTQAKLVEGNYMFYLPYSEEAGRGAIVAKLPAVQKLAKDANGELSTFNDVLAKSKEAGTPLYVGYKFLSADKQDLNIAVDVLPLYAQPLITLQNLANKKVTVKSVTLKKGSDVFELEKPFKYAETAQTAYTESEGDDKSFVQSMFNAVNGKSGKEGRWISNKNTKAIKTADILGSSVAESEGVISIEMPEGGIELANGASFSFYAMIPADDYTTGQYATNALTAEINTADGESCEVVFGDMNINPGKRYPVEEYDATTNKPTSNAGAALTSVIVGLQAQTGVAVSSTADLIEAISTFTPKAGATDLEIRVVDQKNTEINSTVATLLKNKKASMGSKITFSTPVVINNAGTLAIGNNYTLTFSKMVTLKGTNNIAAGTYIVFDDEITVTEGAKATLAGTIAKGVVNKGTLVLSDAAEADITNEGAFTLEKELTGKVTNLGTMSIKGANASITSTLTNGNDKKAAAILNVEKGASVALKAAWTNNEGATINNLGKIEDTSSFALTNNGTIVNGASNNTTAEIAAGNNDNSLNAGTVTNHGIASFKKNEGSITMMSFLAKATIGATGSKWGNIYNDAGAAITGDSNDQYVWKTVTGNSAKWEIGTGKYNSVVYKDAKIAVTAVAVASAIGMKAVVFENTDIAVTGAGDGAVWQLPASVVVNGNVNITAGPDGANVAAITVANMTGGSSFVISKGAVLTINGETGTTFAGGTDGVKIENKGNVQTNVKITNVLGTSAGVWPEKATTGNADNWTGEEAAVKQ